MVKQTGITSHAASKIPSTTDIKIHIWDLNVSVLNTEKNV